MVRPYLASLCVSVAFGAGVAFYDSEQAHQRLHKLAAVPEMNAEVVTNQSPRFDALALPLFGMANAVSVAAPNMPETTKTRLPKSAASYQLTGTIASPTFSPRRALIGSSDSAEHAYAQGDQMPDGAQIVSIGARQVVLSRNGQLESLDLPEPDDLSGSSTPSDTQNVPVLTNPQAIEDQALPPPLPANPPARPNRIKNGNSLKERIARAKQAALARGTAGPIFEPPP